MIKGLWNYAVKVEDLDKTAEFYTTYMGAELRISSKTLGCNYKLIRLGDTRVILFDKAPYEKEWGWDLPPGFLHAVYEVDDFQEAVARVKESDVKFLMEPQPLTAEFGVRNFAFFEAPDGIRTEIMQVIEDSGKA